LAKDGANIVGIVEYNSAIYNPDGLDVDAAKLYFNKRGTFIGFSGATEETSHDPAEFMEKECDILIPAAKECAINQDNADKL
jgi:glutamate dehydrogenase (NAD(P)+)